MRARARWLCFAALAHGLNMTSPLAERERAYTSGRAYIACRQSAAGRPALVRLGGFAFQGARRAELSCTLGHACDLTLQGFNMAVPPAGGVVGSQKQCCFLCRVRFSSCVAS